MPGSPENTFNQWNFLCPAPPSAPPSSHPPSPPPPPPPSQVYVRYVYLYQTEITFNAGNLSIITLSIRSERGVRIRKQERFVAVVIVVVVGSFSLSYLGTNIFIVLIPEN